MRKTAIIAVLFFLSVMSVKAQDYLQIVSFEGSAGANGTFVSAGQSANRKEVETDAVKSLFYTLFFTGVEGVNEGRPLVTTANPMYTNNFFNQMARYTPYMVKVEEDAKPGKIGNMFQGSYRITIRLNQLVNDVRKNTGYVEQKPKVEAKLPKPTIIVVPYKRAGESYASIMEHDSDFRIAVGTVQRGFEDADIKTVDLQARIEAMARRAQYEDNAGAADSNDKQLLMSSGADVYVTVDLMKETANGETRVALLMKAYETASGTIWAAEEGWTNKFRTDQTQALCAYAVNDHLPAFLDQILKNYAQPARAVLQISISGSSIGTLQDSFCSNGEPLMDFIYNWLDENAYEGDYHIQGVMDESAIFDYVMIPREDKNGNKMTAAKFSRMLNGKLREAGISGTVRLEGNTILLMLNL